MLSILRVPIILILFKKIMSQVLRNLPPSFFKPVGEDFIEYYSERYEVDWTRGPWSKYSLAYYIYCDVVGQYNFSHPGFRRSADPRLQVLLLHLDI